MYTTMMVEINENEFEIEIDFEYDPGEKETMFCPGEQQSIDICNVWDKESKEDLCSLTLDKIRIEIEEHCFKYAEEYYSEY
jgi:hypothetical protein